jgi:hypothetical protein
MRWWLGQPRATAGEADPAARLIAATLLLSSLLARPLPGEADPPASGEHQPRYQRDHQDGENCDSDPDHGCGGHDPILAPALDRSLCPCVRREPTGCRNCSRKVLYPLALGRPVA